MSGPLQLRNYQLTIPDYTTLCKRKKTIDVSNKLEKCNRTEDLVFAIDASGLKFFGEKVN